MLWQWVNTGAQVFLLDLDGTLIPSAEIDDKCFWQAVFDCFGVRDVLPDLHNFENVTDTGILHEWCMTELGRPPLVAESRQIKHRFGQLLETAFQLQPGHFSPLPGVEEWLEAAAKNERVYVGIATGGWNHSAQLKLQLSGLDRFDLPLASSDDDASRIGIMKIAAQRTLGHQAARVTDFTYVGDGVWDFRASQDLGWKFIGIASGKRAMQLSAAGADQITQNFCKTRL